MCDIKDVLKHRNKEIAKQNWEGKVKLNVQIMEERIQLQKKRYYKKRKKGFSAQSTEQGKESHYRTEEQQQDSQRQKHTRAAYKVSPRKVQQKEI